MKRVSIYIDGANFYYGLKSLNKRYTDFDFERYVNKIINNDCLVSIYYYNVPLIQKYDKNLYWKQVKFFNRLRKINKMNVILCKRQRRIDYTEKEYYVIKGDDIHLSLDMLRDACKNKYDKAILISGDGDFAQLINYVRKENKEVEVHAFKKLASAALINESNRHVWIDKKTTNKFFWRDKI